MDKEEAKLILGALRPEHSDEAADPLAREALALLARDPELAAWHAEQLSADRRMRAAMATITPPAGLRESLLAAAKTTPISPAPDTRTTGFQWAVAAALIALLGVLYFTLPTGRPGAPLADLQARLAARTGTHQHAFGVSDGNIEKIRAWLSSHGGATDFTLPAGLAAVNGVGCEIVSIDGAKVSVLCFHLPQGGTAHLYVIDRSQIAGRPSIPTARLAQSGAYTIATWTDGRLAYILARQGDERDVQALL